MRSFNLWLDTCLEWKNLNGDNYIIFIEIVVNLETNYIRLSKSFNNDKCEEFELNQLALDTIITEQKDLSLYLVTMK